MNWSAAKANRVLAALARIGWIEKRRTGSHRVLKREGSPNFVFAFHELEEIGPKMLARIAKHTGLKPEDPLIRRLTLRCTDANRHVIF